MPVPSKVADATKVAQATVHGGGFVTLPPHEVARAKEARQRAEALSVLEKAVKADKAHFSRFLGSADEGRDAGGTTLARRNYRSPNQLNQEEFARALPSAGRSLHTPQPLRLHFVRVGQPLRGVGGRTPPPLGTTPSSKPGWTPPNPVNPKPTQARMVA